MNTTMIRPDDRTPEERMRDAVDEAQAEAFAEYDRVVLQPHLRAYAEAKAESAKAWARIRRREFTPMRASLLVIACLWAFTMYHIGDSYSPRVAWLCILCTAWGVASGFLLTFDWLHHNEDATKP